MRYIKLYEEIDFSDIDDIDNVYGWCTVLLFGASDGHNYLGLIDGDGELVVIGSPFIYDVNVVEDINDNTNDIMVGNGWVLDLGEINIKDIIPEIVIIGDDINVKDFIYNLGYYKCSDIDDNIKRLKGIIKKYVK
jgi:hypothetical protein